jgi:DNA replication and repair protein RecF
MIIKTVKLTNFRSHTAYVLNCTKKTSLIVGPNGSGKTSVLEAIYLGLRGKSFRAADDEILQRSTEYYRVELGLTSGEKCVVTYDGNKRQFLVGDKKSARLPKKYKYPVVLFLPDDLHLVGAGPATRRDYFDRVISQLDESYASTLSKYNKTLKQRNELLKKLAETSCGSDESLFSWNVMLAKYGTEIREKRLAFVEEINKTFTEVYRSIAENSDEVELKYDVFGGEVSESGFLKRLTDDFKRDLILGHTSYGVQRDNYEFYFNKVVAEGSASRGEVRSMILAMKFIEADLIYKQTGLKPVVLLDDVFSELDAERQKALVTNFSENQVIITSVEAVEV